MHLAGLLSHYPIQVNNDRSYPPIMIPLMHSILLTVPKFPDEDLLIVGRQSFLISNSLSIWSDQSKLSKSINMVLLALLESVKILEPFVSFFKD
jgi:hypothetical protein